MIKFVPPTSNEAAEILCQSRDDRDDRRCLRGRHAPPTGVCRVCSGVVKADIWFHDTGLIGGPPPPGYIGRWVCQNCKLLYAECPPS